MTSCRPEHTLWGVLALTGLILATTITVVALVLHH